MTIKKSLFAAVFFTKLRKIVEYAGKNSVCAVPGPVSRLMEAKPILSVKTHARQVVEKQVSPTF